MDILSGRVFTDSLKIINNNQESHNVDNNTNKRNDDCSNKVNNDHDHTSQAEAALASALHNLSFQDRETAMNEIHGVVVPHKTYIPSHNHSHTTTNNASNYDSKVVEKNNNVSTDPEDEQQVLQDAIFELDVQLSLLAASAEGGTITNSDHYPHPPHPHHHQQQVDEQLSSTKSFKIAYSQSPVYVRSLYTMFLRRDEYNVQRASNRILNHFTIKEQIWGPNKLGRDITLEDFEANNNNNNNNISPTTTKEDIMALKAGFLQILPQRDRSGRAILVKVFSEKKYQRHEQEKRLKWYLQNSWYLQMKAIRDEETQKKGIVMIIYNTYPQNQWFDHDGPMLKRVTGMRESLPTKLVSLHYCYSDPTFNSLIAALSSHMDRTSFARTKMHRGSHMEVQYSLLGYGIPTKALPVTSDGAIRRKEFIAWLSTLHAVELLEKTRPDVASACVLIPGSLDILFGKGKTLMNHIGNARYGHVLEENLDLYVSSSRTDKIALTHRIYKYLRDNGSRFLRQVDEGYWLEVDEKMATDKISRGFRNRLASRPSSKTSMPVKDNSQSMMGKRSVTPEVVTPPMKPSTETLSDDAVASKRFKIAV